MIARKSKDAEKLQAANRGTGLELDNLLDRAIVRVRSVARVAAVGGHQELFILASRAHEELQRYRKGLAELMQEEKP